MSEVDRYITEVIQRGDEGSALLAAKCAPTLKNSDYVQVLREGMNGVAVLRIPDEYTAIVHGTAGDPHFLNPERHAASLIERLYEQSQELDAIPLGLADVIDASEGGKQVIETIADVLVAGANKYEFAIMNGELAILGNRINCDANISGTMISITKKFGKKNDGYSGRLSDGSPFVVIYPNGLAFYMNSDGTGTKLEFDERGGTYTNGLIDSLAMKLDDTSKLGAKARAVFDVVETRGKIPIAVLRRAATKLGKGMRFHYLLHHEDVGDRLSGWSPEYPALNISGSAVSVIDEERLRSPLVSKEGDSILSMRGRPNPRSNGITDKRKAMIKIFGNDWHKTQEGRMFFEFLSEPSTIFYPVFNALIDEGCATAVYHMSGGAYKGKFAKPLAKHGLYAQLEGLFDPDWRELALAGFLLTPAEVAYAKWPMGNEGFITTNDPKKAAHIINKYGLEARRVGYVTKAVDGRTGIELAGIKGSDGKDVYFSGR